MRFHTSDTQFGHERIITLCDRPFADRHDMNEAMISNWNATVAPSDTVIHYGDVALGPNVEWDGILSRLNGYKILVVGNHDRIFMGNSEKERNKFADRYAGWFNEIHHNIEGFELLDGTVVNMSHFPYDGDSHGHDRHPEFRLPDNGVPLIHGHTHLSDRLTRSTRGTTQIHVGVDAWNYTPVSETTLLELLKSV